LEAASRIEADKEIVSRDLERVRNTLNEQVADESKSEKVRSINAGVMFKYAAMLAAAVLFGLTAHYGLPIDGSSVAWADVVEKFGSIDHFSGVLYIRENISEEPQQVEIWMGKGCRSRIRIGKQVLFGQAGKVVAGFDFAGRRKLIAEEFDEKGERFIEMLGSEGRFSLETIVNSMCGRPALEEVTPLVNADAGISEDIVVFDLVSGNSPEWLRIWALKNSLLPIRVRVCDPRGYEQVDLVISYSKPQSDEFFDPDSYSKAISEKNNDGRVNRAYALLEDAGGRASVPKDLFDKNGYHMPEVEQAGITANGAVWVIATKARNRKPEGYIFDGFRKLQDDLGREYVVLWRTHFVQGNRSVEVFAPKDYPFDKRVPGKLILPCEVQEYDSRIKTELIGTAELSEWKQGAIWPSNLLDQSEYSLILTMADRHCSNRAFDKCDKIIEMIREAGLYEKYEHNINRLKLRILIKKAKFAEASELAMELWPVELDKYKNPGKSFKYVNSFVELIIAVVADGDVDKGVELWESLKEIQPDISHFSKGAQKRAKENIKKQFDEPRHLTNWLAEYTSAENISKIVGFDVTKHEELKHYGFRTDAQIAGERAAQEYLKKLSEFYNTHPLPERMELIEKEKDQLPTIETHMAIFSLRQLPDHEGYSLWPINSKIEHIVTWGVRFSEPIIPSHELKVKYSDAIPDEVLDTIIHADMVYHKDVRVAERFMFVANTYMEKFGLELVKHEGPIRKVLVARHDGRKLKDFKDVKGVPVGDVRGKPGAVGMTASRGFTMESLLGNLVNTQNRDIVLDADKLFMIDETGIDGPVSGIGKHWPGEEGLRLAKEWFEDEFGVTFQEEERALPVWEVRMKQ
ncbi:MAG: hypothetical protein KAS23_17520, partial [Anaerohalosphaera sp.]|nr:hypothetical protein [Anaerohalosphaera sp.]